MQDLVIKVEDSQKGSEGLKPVDPNDQSAVLNNNQQDEQNQGVVDNSNLNQIDIDGVVYNLDDKGNAIDDNNVIKFTADQLKELEDNSNEPLPLEEVFKLTNISPVDESGNPIEYENTPQGIAKYVDDVYNIAAQQAVSGYVQTLFSTYPVLRDVINHLNTNNGNIENFVPVADYNSIQLDPENEEQLKNIIYTARTKRGESKEKIDKYYNYLKDSKTIFTEAEEELNYLQESLTKEQQNRIKAEADAEAKQIQDAIDYWGVSVDKKGNMQIANVENSVYDIIKKGKLKIGADTYNIPDKIKINDNGKVTYSTRDDFFRYLYEPVKVTVGNQTFTMTRHEYDLQLENNKRDVHADVFDAFKRFVKYDTEQFLKEAISQNKTAAIKRLRTDKMNKQGKNPIKSENVRIILPTNRNS